MSAAVELACFG